MVGRWGINHTTWNLNFHIWYKVKIWNSSSPFVQEKMLLSLWAHEWWVVYKPLLTFTECQMNKSHFPTWHQCSTLFIKRYSNANFNSKEGVSFSMVRETGKWYWKNTKLLMNRYSKFQIWLYWNISVKILLPKSEFEEISQAVMVIKKKNLRQEQAFTKSNVFTEAAYWYPMARWSSDGRKIIKFYWKQNF